MRRRKRGSVEVIFASAAALFFPWIQKAGLLREDFEAFYRAPDRPDAEAFLENRTLRCAGSGLAPFITLARRLRR
jgi:hypothetical protein